MNHTFKPTFSPDITALVQVVRNQSKVLASSLKGFRHVTALFSCVCVRMCMRMSMCTCMCMSMCVLRVCCVCVWLGLGGWWMGGVRVQVVVISDLV